MITVSIQLTYSRSEGPRVYKDNLLRNRFHLPGENLYRGKKGEEL